VGEFGTGLQNVEQRLPAPDPGSTGAVLIARRSDGRPASRGGERQPYRQARRHPEIRAPVGRSDSEDYGQRASVDSHASRYGEKALYVDTSYAIGIEDLLPEESAPILRFLGEHITQPAFTCRLRWEPDMVALWDNRLCVHQAYNDYQGYRRELYRTTVVGERPA
jgi:alpha-ketoglutarate-dependent taurine dioxygenase